AWPPPPLKPLRLVDDVPQRVAGGEAADVVEQQGQMSLRDARGIAGDVRREDDPVAHAPERMVGGQRLLLEDVEGRPGKFPGFQGGEEIGKDYDPTPADVDEIGRPFHV